MASASFEMSRRRIDPVAGHVLAEKHDVGLEHAAAAPAGRHGEGRKVGAFEVGVAVRRIGGLQTEPAGVQPAQFVLQLIARRLRSQPMQRTRSSRPCRSITRALPAA